MRVIKLLLLLFFVLLGIVLATTKFDFEAKVPKMEIKQEDFGLYAAGSAKVARVVDGDTIEMENGEKVRYIGINTPESVDPRKGVQCFGKEAAAYNKELVEGKQVWLVKDVSEKDRYERLLRYVYLDDPAMGTESARMVNKILLENGYAGVYTVPPDVKYKDEFLAIQKTARDRKIGLWKSCPVEYR